MNSRLALLALLVCLSPGCSDDEESPRAIEEKREREERRLLEVLRKQEADPKAIIAAAQSGDAAAQEDLGIRYFEGRGVPKSEKDGVMWLNKAAQQGAPNAQFRLGMSYYRGTGVAKDLVQAHGWLTMSAANGCQAAMKILPTISGDMTPEQKVEAARRANEFFEKLNAAKKKPSEPSP